MEEQEAINTINSSINKGFSEKTAKSKPLFFEIEFIFRNNLIEFKKLLDKSKRTNSGLYIRYKELLMMKEIAYKHSGIKGLDYNGEERPPITISTFSMEDMDRKLEEFNKQIKEYKND